jgi:trans-aconitate methyltransferase
LEIGCGSGQVSRDLVRLQAQLTCIDISPSLLNLASRKLGHCKNFEKVSFERLETETKFDLIFAAQSFHWIELAEGFRQARRLLKDDGVLALV